MNDKSSDPNQWQANKLKNMQQLRKWTRAWLISTAVMVLGPKFVWDYELVFSTIAVVINLAVGIRMIITNIRLLKAEDEMYQKIFMDAAASTLGIGLVFGLCYDVLENIRLITFQPEISHLVIFMCLVFLTGLVVGNRRYQ